MPVKVQQKRDLKRAVATRSIMEDIALAKSSLTNVVNILSRNIDTAERLIKSVSVQIWTFKNLLAKHEKKFGNPVKRDAAILEALLSKDPLNPKDLFPIRDALFSIVSKLVAYHRKAIRKGNEEEIKSVERLLNTLEPAEQVFAKIPEQAIIRTFERYFNKLGHSLLAKHKKEFKLTRELNKTIVNSIKGIKTESKKVASSIEKWQIPDTSKLNRLLTALKYDYRS